MTHAGDAPAGGLSPKMVDTISNAVLAVSATHGYHMAIEREDFINKTIVAQVPGPGNAGPKQRMGEAKG